MTVIARLRRLRPRHALVATLAIMWSNYALTARWAAVPGSIHGPKQPLFVALLVITSVAVLWRRRARHTDATPVGTIALVSGLSFLAAAFLVWFPPATWTQLPFQDNWPARFQSTIDAAALYAQGAAAGWEWHFLGGYNSSSDITQNLGTLAALPVALLGPELGFHLLHAALLFALPLMVWIDLRRDAGGATTARLAGGLVAFTVTGWFSYYMLRSGDTNSLAGTVCAIAALTGSHAAARGRRWGAALLILSLTLVNYLHTGFFAYTAVLLTVEAAFYRDLGRARRAALAVATGLITALPLTWESWKYGDYVTLNNVALTPEAFQLEPFLRKIYYNIEIMALPWRWFNDFAGLTNILLPVLVWTAWKERTRTGFYAVAALTVVAMMRFNTPEFAYALLRPVHLLAILPPVALAGFLVRQLHDRRAAALTSVLVVVFLQYLWMPLPHVRTAQDLDPVLVNELQSLDGALVLFENAPHRDMDVDPSRTTVPTPFAAHLEGYLAPATGKRFYAGLWDGWQWSRYRTQVLAGGAFRGRLLDEVPIAEFRAELSRWGIRHLLVWSPAARDYLASHQAFAPRWSHGQWIRFEFLDADPRSVTTSSGRGVLASYDSLGAEVQLSDVRAGAMVVVRTNYYPAWTAAVGDEPVALMDHDGQLAFRAPIDGSYVVQLSYPRRPGLVVLAFAVLAVALVIAVRTTRTEGPVTRPWRWGAA